MALRASDLLSGERVVMSKRARLLAEETVGGRLYLTGFRLVFRARGTHLGILLPTIKDLRQVPAGRRQQLDILTEGQQFTFVMRGVLRLIAETVLRVDTDADRTKRLADIAMAQLPTICGDPAIARRIEASSDSAFTTLTYHDAADAITQAVPSAPHTPTNTAAALNLAELLRDERCV